MTMILDVRKNPSLNRYEYATNGYVAVADYTVAGDVVTLTHVIVPAELEGKGIGSGLVKFALDDIRAQGLKVIPQCPFAATYIARHPEYQDLLA